MLHTKKKTCHLKSYPLFTTYLELLHLCYHELLNDYYELHKMALNHCYAKKSQNGEI